MSDKIAVILEFDGYTQEELQDYLILKFGLLTKGRMTVSVLSQIGYKRAKAVILDRPKLNENQQIVLDWLKKGYFNPYIKSALSNLYFYVNMTAIGDLEDKGIKEMVNAYEKLSHKEFAQVLQAFSQWALEQEEE